MAVKIDYKSVNGRDAAYLKAKSVVTPEYTEKFQVKATVAYDDAQKIITSSGKGFTLTLCFFDTYCEADINLSLLLRPLKNNILSKIEHQIAKNL